MQYVSGEDRPQAGTVTVAHDLRQYLAAGLLLTEDDREDTAGSPRSRLATVHGLLLSMRDLVAAELDDPGGGQAPPTARPVDLAELGAECLRVAETTHRCAVRLTSHARVVVRSDGVALRRAVMNVVDNAGRAAGERGTVEVTVDVRGECAVITVADDGLGFGRIESRSGHGLGIVDRALHSCGGWLEVASTPGAGTQVTLTVPVRAERRAG
ncbi:MAG: sensor histidine kinase [Nocardioidaceae bacterium]